MSDILSSLFLLSDGSVSDSEIKQSVLILLFLLPDVAILILFFLDAIREMQKYSTEELQQQKAGGMSHLDAQMQMHMRLFRAQRNFYIAG